MSRNVAWHRRWLAIALVVCIRVLGDTQPVSAQASGAADARTSVPPKLPAVLIRNAAGTVFVRATRITQPMKIDGQLDEAVYSQVAAITEFIQLEPKSGEPVTEKTEAWVLFDDQNIYISCRCWDSLPDRIIAQEMRRDSSNLLRNDNFAVEFDTFNDGRNALLMYVTAAGGIRDGLITDERMNADWNPVWTAKVGRSRTGWTAEMAFPFKSLRYGSGRQQTWGIQMRRTIAGKNETAFLTPLDPAWGLNAINHTSASATLVGLEVPPSRRTLEIKPYAIARVTTDLVRTPAARNDVTADAGVDLKYGLTKGLTADVTYKTDFAQVEADEEQVNLTRFSLSFPEKREFFVEGQGIFAFGVGGSGSNSTEGDASDAPAVFYSRRIGLNGSRQIPVIGGGRLTGKAGAWSIGALSIETGKDETSGAARTNFSVLRMRRDVLRKSAVGAIFANRSVSTRAPGSNSVWGVDTNLGFHENVYLGGYLARSRTDGLRGNDLTYRGQFGYTADRYGLTLDRLVVEENFNPEIGFLRRENFRRNYAQARFSPRPRNNRLIRKLTAQSSFEYTTDNKNHLETRELWSTGRIDFHNSDAIVVDHLRTYEFLPAPFQISRGVHVPVGGYAFNHTKLSWVAGQQHRLSGTASVEVGGFYNGDKTTLAFKGRVVITPQLGIEPNVSINRIDLAQGRFTTSLAGARTTFTVTPQMFVAALVQYNSGSASLSANLRFRWEYQPGSELFVVYTDGRSTLAPRGTVLQNRGFVVKVNRLFRF